VSLTRQLEAAVAVLEQRAADHGDFVVVHERIARLWSAYLERDVRADQVAAMMALLKLARSEVSPENDDHVVDLAGYVAIYGSLQKRGSQTPAER
tara:strand:+ start:946 stop:1230 length:285 start_codon:yes stop_codon:yes gene_type:complete